MTRDISIPLGSCRRPRRRRSKLRPRPRRRRLGRCRSLLRRRRPLRLRRPQRPHRRRRRSSRRRRARRLRSYPPPWLNRPLPSRRRWTCRPPRSLPRQLQQRPPTGFGRPSRPRRRLPRRGLRAPCRLRSPRSRRRPQPGCSSSAGRRRRRRHGRFGPRPSPTCCRASPRSHPSEPVRGRPCRTPGRRRVACGAPCRAAPMHRRGRSHRTLLRLVVPCRPQAARSSPDRRPCYARTPVGRSCRWSSRSSASRW
jgi:hypothetical protein